VGAISEVAANAVNSLTPAPAPAIAIPAIKIFIVCAVLQTIIPRQMSEAPIIAT
jgi:hypothetical protein